MSSTYSKDDLIKYRVEQAEMQQEMKHFIDELKKHTKSEA